MTKSNGNASNATTIHISFERKGGVGRSLVPAILSPYLASGGQDARGIDADPVSRARGTMNRTTEIDRQASGSEPQDQQYTQQHSANRNAPRLVACVLLLPEDAEVLAGLLHDLTANLHACQNPDAVMKPASFLRPESPDSWLPHVEAAKSLGVSKSTLYHYSCHGQIERRKLAGRLEYRRSTLDKFKEDRTQPAGRRSSSERIIGTAHSSGK